MAQFCYETGIDSCKQAGLQTDIKKNISGSCEMLYVQGLGTEQITVVPKRQYFVPGCQEVPRRSMLLPGVGKKCSE